MSGWKGKLPWMEPKCITHKVSDEDVRFYAMSTDLIFKLKAVAQPLSQALTVLFAKHDADGTAIQRTFGKNSDEGTEIIQEPCDVKMAEFRAKQKSDAVNNLLNAFMEESNAAILGEIILDSLKGVVAELGNDYTPSPKTFIKETPLPILGQLLVGVAKANKGVFGPLADRIQEAMEATVSKIKNKADADQKGKTQNTDGVVGVVAKART